MNNDDTGGIEFIYILLMIILVLGSIWVGLKQL